jgi:GTP 3',8-cyclase
MIQNRRDLVDRIKLSEAVPLKTPFTIYVDPSSACNFKCDFCYHSIDNHSLKKINFQKQIMKMELYKQIIDSIGEFPEKIKMLSLFNKGEPLLNSKLPEMILMAKKKRITEKIYITTNGALLSPVLNRKLIDSGLDEILISIEGIDSAEYKKITGVDIDFDELVSNIKDFYINRLNCKCFIKTVTYAKDEEKVKKFHEIFDPICDFAYIEQVVPVFDRVNYENMVLDRSKLNKFGRPIHVCTRPFFNMCVHSNGDIGACLVDYIPEILFGNVKNDSLNDVWNGAEFNKFRLMHLKKKRYDHFKCGHCVSPDYDSQESDLLDDESDRLIQLIKNG